MRTHHSQRPNRQSKDHEIYDVIELVAITMMLLSLSLARFGKERTASRRCSARKSCCEVAVHGIGNDREEIEMDSACEKNGGLFMDHFLDNTHSPHPPPPQFVSD